MATIEQVNLRLNDALLEANQQLRNRLAHEMWDNKRLRRSGHRYYQEVLELEAIVEEMEAELYELKRKIATWEGD